MALTGKTIGQLTYLSEVTTDTLFAVELSGDTYQLAYSAFTNSNYNTGTYEQLYSFATGSTLTAGSFYLMNDYQTCYDQPNYDNSRNPINTGNYMTGTTEPILLLATTTTGFSPTIYSTLHTKDKITYDITWNTTEVTNSPAKGRITERIDNFNNRTDYDHRSILFKRYNGYSYIENQPLSGFVGISGITGTTAVLYGNTGTTFNSNFSQGSIVSIRNLNPSFFEVLSVESDSIAVISGVTINETTDSPYYNGDENGIMSYYQPNIRQNQVFEYTTFDISEEVMAVNNYIGNQANLYIEDGNGDFLLANNVFLDGSFINNVIGNGSYNNTFNDDCDNNQIGDRFYNNSTNDDFDGNIIGEGFNNNYITSNFNNNRIGSDFNDNILLGGSFYRNNIGNYFEENNWTDNDFQNNEIGNQFNNNKIYDDFYNNDIGNGYNGNESHSSFYRNLIGNGYNNNTVYSYFYENNIGNSFYNNTLSTLSNRNDFSGNIIGNYFENNTILSQFNSNTISNQFTQNNIYSTFIDNVIGANSNNNVFGLSDNVDNYSFGRNMIGSNMIDNRFSGNTELNTIGHYFEENNVDTNFSFNKIGNYFITNTIANDFGFGGGVARGNTIGNYFESNTIGEYFYDNQVSDLFYNNIIGDDFQLNNISAYNVNNTDFTVNYGNISTISYVATGTTATDNTYLGITGTTNSENGIGASFDITVVGGLVTYMEGGLGKLYSVGDVITILGTSIGGLTPVDDVVITIDAVSSTPVVYTSTNANIVKNSSGQYKLYYLGGSGIEFVDITSPFD